MPLHCTDFVTSVERVVIKLKIVKYLHETLSTWNLVVFLFLVVTWLCIYIYICIYICIYIYTIYIYTLYIYTIYIYIIHTYIYKWIMVKNTTKFQVLKVSCKYFAVFSLITTLSTDVTKSLHCKYHLTSCLTLML